LKIILIVLKIQYKRGVAENHTKNGEKHNIKNQPYPTPMKLMKKCVDEIFLCGFHYFLCDFRIKS
jgi:hypothetical protein